MIFVAEVKSRLWQLDSPSSSKIIRNSLLFSHSISMCFIFPSCFFFHRKTSIKNNDVLTACINGFFVALHDTVFFVFFLVPQIIVERPLLYVQYNPQHVSGTLLYINLMVYFSLCAETIWSISRQFTSISILNGLDRFLLFSLRFIIFLVCFYYKVNILFISCYRLFSFFFNQLVAIAIRQHLKEKRNRYPNNDVTLLRYLICSSFLCLHRSMMVGIIYRLLICLSLFILSLICRFFYIFHESS